MWWSANENRARRLPGAGVPGRSGYTLVELILVVGLMAALFAFAVPNLISDIEQRRLPESARKMRALLTLVRANAMYDGKRYRVRFPAEDELDARGGERQPLIEREDDPFLQPGEFAPVRASWVHGVTLLEGVWCAEVRLGRPTLEVLEDDLVGEALDEELEAMAEGYEAHLPPLYVEPDGTSEWATFLLTNADPDTELEELVEEDKYTKIEVIMDGFTGLIWLQRPFYDEELEMFEEHGWPPVLRRDFVRTAALTEEEVLEISETRVRK